MEEQILESTDRHRLQHLYSKFSKLDWERIRYMKRAEALCKQRKNRAYEWSPTLAKMGGGNMLLENEKENDQRHIHNRHYRETKRFGNK